MKKLVSMLLILCLLCMIPAFAADAKLGVDMHALEGLDFILMENRHMLEDDELRNRMQWAYETIHETGHFSEMAAQGHELGIVQDINQELVEMGLSLTAYDYLIYDSFELKLDEKYASKLENGNVLEVSFNLNLEREVSPVVLLSNDEMTWKCVDHENVVKNGDVLTVRFSELGTVLVLVDVYHGAPAAGEPDSNFTPSVTGKAAPDLVPPKGAAEGIIARIYDETKQMVSEVPDEGWLVITPVSRRDQAEDKEVRERLEWAYNQIQTTKRLGNLAGADGLGIAAAIDKVLDASGFEDLTSDDMIVRDLFNAGLYGTEYVDALNDDGHYIELTFDLKAKKNDPLVILVTNDNQSWQVLDWADYTINADGTVTLRLEELGTIAILVDSDDRVINKENANKSPKTGE